MRRPPTPGAAHGAPSASRLARGAAGNRSGIAVTAASAAAAALLACGSAGGAGGPADAAEPRQVPFTTIEQASVPGKGGGEVRAVVRDAAAWQRVWDDLTSDSGREEEAPAVDFEREMILAAAMPTQGCISRVTLRGVAEEDGGLVVDLLEQPPPAHIVCVVSERPFHAVRLARHDGPVRWEVETRPLEVE